MVGSFLVESSWAFGKVFKVELETGTRRLWLELGPIEPADSKARFPGSR